MEFRIPQDGKFSQPNKGDISGNLFNTKGIDLRTNPGKLRASPRLVVNTKDNDSGITGMGVPLGFAQHDAGSGLRYYTACGIGGNGAAGTGKVLVSASDSPTAVFFNDTTTNTPTNVHADYNDIVEWTDGNSSPRGRALFVSTTSAGAGVQNIARINATIDNWDPTWFTVAASGSTALVSAAITNMCPAFNGNLYITSGSTVIYVPPSTNDSVVPAVLTGTTGTLNFYGRYIAIWIRSTSDALWIGLIGTDGKGYVARWNGVGTAPQAIYDIDAPCALSAVVKENVIHIIDAYGKLKKFTGTGFDEIARLPVANLSIEMPGIYNSRTNSRWIHHRGMDIVNGKININVSNYVSSGVYINEMPSGVWEYDENIGLYHKSAPCVDTNDYGQQFINTAGALYGVNRSTASFLVGNSIYTDNVTTARNTISYDDIATNTNKRSTYTTPFLNATDRDASFRQAAYRFSPLPSGDKIVGKYRSAKKANLPFSAAITWTSTTTFTSVDTNFQYASVGDEIEGVMGKGASSTAHISAISENAGTYTITLEEAIGFTSGTAKVRVENFQKAGVISALIIGSDSLSTPSATNTKIQMKTEVRFSGNTEIDDLTVLGDKHR